MKMTIITSIDDPLYASCRLIRDIVFLQEQKVPETREIDGLDDQSTHYLFSQDNKAFGTARSRTNGDIIKIERFGFLPEMRGSGLGAQAFQMVMDHCRDLAPGLSIMIGAQAYLCGFYERLGFQAEGPIFQDAGIDHVKMVAI